MTAAFACSPGGRCFNLVVAYAWGTALVKNGTLEVPTFFDTSVCCFVSAITYWCMDAP